MENRQQQILSEIKEMMSSIRMQLEQLDMKMAEFQYEIDPQEFMADPIDLDLGDAGTVRVVGDLPVEDSPLVEEPPVEIVEEEAVTLFEAAQTAGAEKQVVLDALTARQAWRTDMPGAPVRDIRSAISLNDRVLFINRLFNEDPVDFQQVLSDLNQMAGLDEAVSYIAQAHPEWDFDSEIVYRFMMALRRKISM